jgi:hypothetical protein
MERDDIEAAIRSAFAGVSLGPGVSLRQAEAIDDYGGGLSNAEFDALPRSEETDDWTRVPEDELTRDCVSHLDADGLRYYVPALMLWLLEHYDDEDRLFSEGAEMTAIGTIMALAPYPEFETNHWHLYDTFSAEQRAAIASYVEALPRLVNLDYEDAASLARSLDGYWAEFLPPRSH